MRADDEALPDGVAARVAAERARTAEIEAEAEALAARLDARFRELAQLTRALETARAEAARVEAERDAARFRAAALDAALEAERAALRAAAADLAARDRIVAYARELERRHVAMLESETWRAMEPVRRVLRLLRRRPEPPPFVPRLAAPDPAPGDAPAGRALQLDEKLWGGFSAPALADLAALRDAERAGPDAAEAAWALARWDAARGDHATAYENVVRMRAADRTKQHVTRRVLLEAECLRRLGRPEEARDLLQEALRRKPDAPELCMAMANSHLAPDEAPDPEGDRLRLGWLNRAYAQAGLMGLALHDPGRPLGVDNLAGAGEALVVEGPLVSVIMPAFRAAATLPFALRGLQRQTWTNLEIIVVDDASPDDTFAAAERAAAGDPRVRVLRQPENRGGYAARNAGLAVARGDFVTTHDADDWSHPQKIETQVRRALERPETAANFSEWVRCSARLHVGWLFRAWGGYAAKSMSSILLRRAAFDALGGWDDVRVGGDTDLLRRVEALFGGPGAVETIRSGAPLAFALHSESSLTLQGASHVRTMLHGARREYNEAGAFFRETAGADPARLRFPPEGHGARRPFPAPLSILGRRDAREAADLLFVSDFALKGGAFVSTLNAMNAARAAGLSVAAFHWRRYDLAVSQALNPLVRRLAQDGAIRVIAPGEAVRATTIVVGYPVVLAQPIDLFPRVEFENLVVVVNQMASRLHGGGDPQYDPAALRARLREMFGREGVWAPISGLVHELMRADPRYPAPSDTIWTPLIDVRSWCATPLVWRGGAGGPPTLGRHARDHYTKWPADPAALRAAYCVDRPCRVEIMGGAERALAVLGAQPDNWTVLPFGALEAQPFLDRLDFFLHYPHEDYIEEFGRAVLEALAAGKPAILPPVFRGTFGEAAVYAEPAGVWEAVAALWADETAYLAQARRGRDFVAANSDWSRFPARLAATVAAGGGAAAAPGLAAVPA